MAYRDDILSFLNPDEGGTGAEKKVLNPEMLKTLLGNVPDAENFQNLARKTLSPESQPNAYVTQAEQKRRQDLAEAYKTFIPRDEQGKPLDENDRPIGAEPTPQWKLDKAKDLLDKQTAEAVAPLENFYNYQTQGGGALKLSANASPSQKAYFSALSTNIAEQAPVVPGSIEDLQQYTNLKEGRSYRMLQDLGIEYPGTGKTAPVFQPDAPAKGIPRATPVTGGTAQVDNTGLTTTIGSEFGEVDNPARGGYTESGWNIGAWGDPISGKDTKLAALPVSVLKGYGNPGDKNFAKNFNSAYEIQAVNPDTGQAVSIDLGDKGPGASTGAGIDLTMGSRAALGLPENFKGKIQYRIVKRGSALPSGTTSSAGMAGPTGPTGAAGPAANEVYVQPIDPKKLRDPSIYGDRNTPEDNMLWARHLSDLYATEMDKAGTPITTEEYKKRFDTFLDAGDKKVKGEAPKDLSPQDSDRFTSLATTMDQLDELLQAKKDVGGGPFFGVGLGDKQSIFFAKRNLLSPNISKGLGGQTGAPSDSDIKRAESLLPTENDSYDAAKAKVDYLKNLTNKQMEMMIRIRRGEHYNTSALEKEYLRLQPARQVAQGIASRTSAGDKISNTSVAPAGSAQPSPLPSPR